MFLVSGYLSDEQAAHHFCKWNVSVVWVFDELTGGSTWTRLPRSATMEWNFSQFNSGNSPDAPAQEPPQRRVAVPVARLVRLIQWRRRRWPPPATITSTPLAPVVLILAAFVHGHDHRWRRRPSTRKWLRQDQLQRDPAAAAEPAAL
uniref:(northern house mosquito) hypothetical protein n=1 Tax=Culex pipiens TaxID=7175 RepID=A0A8D8HUS9_CULPI